jgi:Fe-S cluster biosynthesis and repair protein YggX
MKLHRERGLTVEVFEKDSYKHYMIINEGHLGVEDADERKWLV